MNPEIDKKEEKIVENKSPSKAENPTKDDKQNDSKKTIDSKDKNEDKTNLSDKDDSKKRNAIGLLSLSLILILSLKAGEYLYSIYYPNTNFEKQILENMLNEYNEQKEILKRLENEKEKLTSEIQEIIAFMGQGDSITNDIERRKQELIEMIKQAENIEIKNKLTEELNRLLTSLEKRAQFNNSKRRLEIKQNELNKLSLKIDGVNNKIQNDTIIREIMIQLQEKPKEERDPNDLFLIVRIVISLFAILLCFHVRLSKNYDINEKTWAATIIGTVLGYWFGNISAKLPIK